MKPLFLPNTYGQIPKDNGYIQPYAPSATGQLCSTINTLYLVPILIPVDLRVIGIGIYVTIASSVIIQNVSMGIYDFNLSDNLPKNLLGVGNNAIALDTGPSFSYAICSIDLSPGIYYIGFVFGAFDVAAATAQKLGAVTQQIISSAGTGGAVLLYFKQVALTYVYPLPTVAPASGYSDGGTLNIARPILQVRAR